MGISTPHHFSTTPLLCEKMLVQQLEVILLFRKGKTWSCFFVLIIILLSKGPDGIKIREESQKQEMRCQGNKGQAEKSLEKLLCASTEKSTHWGLSQRSLLRFTRHQTVLSTLPLKEIFVLIPPDRKKLLGSLNPNLILYKGRLQRERLYSQGLPQLFLFNQL